MLAFLCSRKNPPADIEVLAAEYPRKKDMFRERMSKIGVSVEIRELVQELRPSTSSAWSRPAISAKSARFSRTQD